MRERLTRRVAGNLSKRLQELKLQDVEDPRAVQGRRWRLHTLLGAALIGATSGCKGLAQVEELTDEMSEGGRRLLGLRRRVPDTTMRGVLIRVSPAELRRSLHKQIRAAHRRKALRPQHLPFGVLALDGKTTLIDVQSGKFAQPHDCKANDGPGKLRTVTASLLSSSSKACIDAVPIPASTNESGIYTDVVADLLSAYGSLSLFQLVSYDAGACCKTNARNTREMGLDYIFRLKEGQQPKLHAEAVRELGERPIEQADASITVREPGKRRERRSVFVYYGHITSWPRWAGAQCLLRLRYDQLDEAGNIVSSEDRYSVSSIKQDVLTPAQWITVIRGHWAVENNCHHTLDTIFAEDDRPWIVADETGALNCMILRRMALNILAFARAVTMRRDNGKMHRWRDLLRWTYNVLISASLAQVEDLSERRAPPLRAAA